MNNISFKASFEGMENKRILQTVFERRTKDDQQHKIVFTKNPAGYGEDKFELFKNGEKTVEYKTEVDEHTFFIEKLIRVYNFLRIKEGQAEYEKLRQKD